MAAFTPIKVTELKHRHLAGISLTTGKLITHWPINESDLELETITRHHDGLFAFYGRNDKLGYKFRQHWIDCIDPEN